VFNWVKVRAGVELSVAASGDILAAVTCDRELRIKLEAADVANRFREAILRT
jgi:hypothetical protein